MNVLNNDYQHFIKQNMNYIYNDFGARLSGISLLCMVVNFNNITIIVTVLSFLINLIKASPKITYGFIKTIEILKKYRKGESIKRDILEETKKERLDDDF